MSTMSSTTRGLSTGGPAAGGDEFDDLFDYDVGGEDDPFSENYKAPGPPPNKQADKSKDKSGDGLGLDEEVEVSKKLRAPRVKLDEHRLLSAAGIPKLRKKAKDLKFKGKGHEFSDAAKLLAFYQLWLDDLFPKARFLDALAMVEKMGHKKQLQMARMEWINEGKPSSSVHEDSIFDEPALPPREDGDRTETAPRIAPIFEKTASERPKTPALDTEMDDNIYNATPQATRQTQPAGAGQQESIFGGGNKSLFGLPKTVVDDAPPEDDLDALLAEEEEMMQSAPKAGQPAIRTAGPRNDDFDDEMEAMAEMGDMW